LPHFPASGKALIIKQSQTLTYTIKKPLKQSILIDSAIAGRGITFLGDNYSPAGGFLIRGHFSLLLVTTGFGFTVLKSSRFFGPIKGKNRRFLIPQ
jgi:hypothetical protein